MGLRLLHTHAHDLLHKLLLVIFWSVDFFPYLPWLVAIDVSCGHMGKYFQLFAFFCEVEHFHKAEVVYLDGLLDRVVEIYRCRAIHDDVNIFDKTLLVLWREA